MSNFSFWKTLENDCTVIYHKGSVMILDETGFRMIANGEILVGSKAPEGQSYNEWWDNAFFTTKPK
jgi:hypothetical protein